MAIFHLNAKVIGIGQGKKSAISAASYRAGERLYDEINNQTYKYKRKDVSDSFIMLPEEAPEEFKDRQHLWNQAQQAELLKDGTRYRNKAVLAREIDVALPKELTLEENKEALQKFAQEHFISKGLIADVCIHGAESDNPHAHIMFTTRPVSSKGKFGKKERSVEPKHGKDSFLYQMRENWANILNESFKKKA